MAMASIANCSLEISRISQLGIWCFGLKVVWRPHSCNLAMRPCVFFWKVKWFRNSGCFNFVSWNMIPMYSNSIQFTYSGDITYIHCWYLFLCLVDLILTHSSGVQGRAISDVVIPCKCHGSSISLMSCIDGYGWIAR